MNCLCTNIIRWHKLEPILKNTNNSVNLYLKLNLYMSDMVSFVNLLTLHGVQFRACGW
jgi:hypothetical protein